MMSFEISSNIRAFRFSLEHLIRHLNSRIFRADIDRRNKKFFDKLDLSMFGCCFTIDTELVLLFIVTLVSTTTVFGGSSSNIIFDSVASEPESNDYGNCITESSEYSNCTTLKSQDSVEYLELNPFTGQGEFGLCRSKKENYVPCYGVPPGYLLNEFDNDDDFDRHCEVFRSENRCLVPPPKGYKIPARWPAGRDLIWSENVKMEENKFISARSLKRRSGFSPEKNQFAFELDGIRDYSHQIAEKIGLRNDSEFLQVGVCNVLDIGCGYTSYGAHLTSLKVMSICIGEYEESSSQVQLALERGLPAMIGNFSTRLPPYPSLSNDMIHCSQCASRRNMIGKKFLIEVDRLLKPGGYFVMPSPSSRVVARWKGRYISKMIEELQYCWKLRGWLTEPFVWQKSADANCYLSRKRESIPLCGMEDDVQKYYKPLRSCLIGPTNKRWIAVQNLSSKLDSTYLENLHGVRPEDFQDERTEWSSVLKNYWSLLAPLIFSDHPKRLTEEDPLPPFNMIRNVMDMNAHYGGFNAALLEEKKLVWVMNIVPVGSSTPFLSSSINDLLAFSMTGVSLFPLTQEPTICCTQKAPFTNQIKEGWVILYDTVEAIEMARMIAIQMHWEARAIDLQNGIKQQLLVCQKPFLKR
ncbi:unnamed protein product [Citrullus colocynthis]|uniref:Methyltransferase n=1 Tax=Citrullus colocynthis TaxID=252529 RepID=A0ABP0XYB4_9ROSI